MYILELNQQGMSTELGLFSTIAQGREFLSKLEAYKYEEEDEFEYESLEIEKIPNYLEVEFNNNIIPFTKFMFTGEGKIDIFWKEIPDLTVQGKGIVKGSTRVDAYSIQNNEVKEYINKREKNYELIKEYLEEKNYEVTRTYFGSEDGEAILYKKSNTDDWHFLSHLDPGFCDEDIKSIIESI